MGTGMGLGNLVWPTKRIGLGEGGSPPAALWYWMGNDSSGDENDWMSEVQPANSTERPLFPSRRSGDHRHSALRRSSPVAKLCRPSWTYS